MGFRLIGSTRDTGDIRGSERALIDEEIEGESGLCFGHNRGASTSLLMERIRVSTRSSALGKLEEFILENLK